MTKVNREILAALRESKGYLSGERLSRSLGVSRTAIWKQIQILRNKGYQIEASTRLGYRLKKVPDLLFPAEVKNGLKTKILGREIYHFKEVLSTIDIARDLATKGCPEGTLVVAETQRRGRGRLGRRWFSPWGGIWITLILRPNLPPMDAPKITFLMAVAATTAIEEETGLEAKIKWPNDIIVKGRKAGGVLSEIDAEPDRVIFALLSLGFNVNVDLKEFPAEIRAQITSLKEAKGEKVNRVNLLQSILRNLEKNYWEVKEGKFSATLSQWKARCETLGREIKVSTTYGIFQGKAKDIDEHGALLLKLSSGEVKAIPSGDATLL